MVIISGPSTIGKNPLIDLVCSQFNYKYIVPVTTRNRRKNETDKKDYFFLDKKTFKEEISNGEIFQWDYCLSNYYGFYKFNLNQKEVITHSLSRMAMRFKAKEQSITTIFLMPKNIDNIKKTLSKIYSGLELNLRMELLNEEILHSSLFDYVFTIEKGIDLIANPEFISIIK